MAANRRQLEDRYSVDAVREQAAALESRYGGLEPELVIELALYRFFPDDQVAAVSSFGAESAVLLHMISEIDRNLPILFLDTQKHFIETIDYRDALVSDLGLSDIRSVKPDPEALSLADLHGSLHTTDPDACCRIRKVEPMLKSLSPFSAWFTGRKRFQAGSRNRLPVFEAVGAQIRINPLAQLTPVDIKSYLYTNKLREHPLVAHGYLSIGCGPCTERVQPGQDQRAGRWAGSAKTECGIHFTADGKIMPLSAASGAN